MKFSSKSLCIDRVGENLIKYQNIEQLINLVPGTVTSIDSGKFIAYLVIGFILISVLYNYIISPSIAMGKSTVFNLSVITQRSVEVQRLSLDTGEFVGVAKRKRPNGFGKIDFSNGDIHAGNFIRGKRNGKGITLYSTGDKYIGKYKKDFYNGFGFLLLDNNAYIGNFKKGKKNGIGVQISEDGIFTIDQYKNDRLKKVLARVDYNHGNVEIPSDSKLVKVPLLPAGFAIGEFKKDKANGFVAEFTNEYLYFGNYKRNKVNGYGAKVLKNGNIEFGDRKGNKLTDAILFIGNVTKENPMETIFSSVLQGASLGSFNKSTKEGYGMEYSYDGNIYVGNYKRSQWHGKGAYVFEGGRIVTGRFRRGEFVR